MSKTISIHNDGKDARFVMGIMIAPGETRVFTEDEAPPELRPGAEALPGVVADDPLLALVALPVGKIALGLPELDDDELDRLEALEQAKDKPRAGALAEITGERLRRAEAGTPGGLDEGADGTDEETDAASAGEGGEA
jgi:hypothetical protein